ncbi:MAG: hypothetical protein A2Y14_00570 [Verrucomicrobia bacterium GWF2_51_19]|nr:MAG: hypothetical protein A2Y14_00570 [Verrucomicrobia bacterium GWF2_51_19]
MGHFLQSLKIWLKNPHIDFFPAREAVYGYTRYKFFGDFRAGFNVALLAFPQAMAYAMIAGLPLQYGIFGSAIASIAAALFSGSRYVMLGPTNPTAILLLSSFAALGFSHEQVVQYLPLFLLLVSLFLIVGSFLRLANITHFVSKSVVFGYITAGAILVIGNQVHNVLGYTLFDAHSAMVRTFYDVCLATLSKLPLTQWPSVVLSLFTFVVFWAVQKWLPALPNIALTLAASALLAYGMESHGLLLKYLDPISLSEWRFTLPAVDFDMLSLLANPAVALAFLCLLESASIGKSLAAESGGQIDANQTMFSVGLANLGSVFFSGMPASGSLLSSTVNCRSGARTTMSGLFAGLLMFAGVLYVGPYMAYVPKASLAVVVIFFSGMRFNRHAIRLITRTTTSDAFVFFATLTSGLLFPLNTAIYFGVGLSVLLFLKKAAMPEMSEYAFNAEGMLTQMQQDQQRLTPEISIIHIEGNLFFAASELFRDQIKHLCERPNVQIIILKMRNAHLIDASCIMAMEELLQFMHNTHRYLILSEVRSYVRHVIENSGLLELIGPDNLFPDNKTNPTLSTARALKQAQKLIGQAEANIHIFAPKLRKQPPLVASIPQMPKLKKSLFKRRIK